VKIFHITSKGSLIVPLHCEENKGVKESYLFSFCSKEFEIRDRFLLDVLEISLFASARICKVCFNEFSKGSILPLTTPFAFLDKFDSYHHSDFSFPDRDNLAIFRLLLTQSLSIEELGALNEQKITSKQF